MLKYRKSVLSMAAAIAISATALSADYIPLSTTANDSRWVLFGVTGFASASATVTATTGEFTIADSVANALTDPTADVVAVDGLTYNGQNFGTLKAVEGVSTVPVEVRVDVTNLAPIWNEEEPVRTIYVDTDGDANNEPNFMFTYKASLEGQRLEFSVDGGQARFLTINYENTFDNPYKAGGASSIITNSGGAGQGDKLDKLLHTVGTEKSAVDYDFANNPPLVANYDYGNHRNVVDDANLRVYTYDNTNELWQIFDTDNEVGTNDFDTLVRGKAYWAKLDTNSGNDPLNSNESGGMVLGGTEVNATQYTDSVGLKQGWNLLAFDDSDPKIRHSATGVILDVTNANDDDTFEILDSSGNHQLQITLNTDGLGGALGTDTAVELAKSINAQVSAARAAGTMPKTFYVTAYPGTDADELILLSDKKFSFTETNGGGFDVIASVSTLSGATTWNETAEAAFALATDVTDAEVVSSVYGEYGMVVEPLVGAGTASDLTLGAKVKVALTSDADETPKVPEWNNGDTLATTQAQLDATGTGGIIKAVQIDLDLDGTNEHVLMAAAEPFTVRDNTFTRVFNFVEDADDTAGTIEIQNSGTPIASQTIIDNAGATTATNISAAINGGAALSAGTPAGDTNKVVIVHDYDNGSNYKVLESVGDHLEVSSTSEDMAKGAIKAVHSLHNLAKRKVSNTLTIVVNAIRDSGSDTLSFDIITELGTITGTNVPYNVALNPADNIDADNSAYLDGIVTQINADFVTAGIKATASHDYDNALDASVADAVITISNAEDIIGFTENIANDAVGATEVFTITINSGLEAGNDTVLTFTDTLAVGIPSAALTAGDGPNEAATALAAAINGNAGWSAPAPVANVITVTALGANATSWIEDHTDANIAITAGGAGDTTAFTWTIAAPTTQGAGTVAEAAATLTADLGSLQAPSGDLETNLRYNRVYTPNFVLDGPLFTIKEAGYDIHAMVSGTTDLANGDVTWDSIDMTRPPSEWLNSQDYNLFEIDAEAGYWVYLEPAVNLNSIAITGSSFSPNYTHHFDTDDETYNEISGGLSITVTGINTNIDDAASARVTAATASGKEVELTPNATYTSFTGEISTYESGLSLNQATDVSVKISDGLGNNYSTTLTIDKLDNVEPSGLNVTRNGLDINVSSTSTDVSGVYVFQDVIPETSTEAAKIEFSSTLGTITNICANMTAITTDISTATTLKVIAVDGDNGTLSNGNASNAFSLAYVPVQKDRMVITDSHNGGTPEATEDATDYNTSCESTGTLVSKGIDTGVSLSAIDDATVRMAYTSEGQELITSVPVSIYVSPDGTTGTTRVKLTYPDTYIGKLVFLEIDNKVYSYELLSERLVGAAGYDSNNPIALTADEVAGVTSF